jgi:HEAT repeat protein
MFLPGCACFSPGNDYNLPLTFRRTCASVFAARGCRVKTTAWLPVCLAAGLLLLHPASLPAGQQPSPVVWGRSLEQWQAAAASPDARIREHALAALERLGRRARVALPVIEKALSDPARPVRLQACRDLAALGPQSVPQLLDLLASSDLAEPALAALQRMEAEAVPGVLQALRSPEVRRRRGGALAAADLPGDAVRSALPRALRDADGLVRVHAAAALLKKDESTRPAVGVLVEALQGQEPEARLQAATVLTRFASSAGEALAPLEKTLRTATGLFRVRVAAALWRTDFDAAGRAFHLLLEAVQDRDEDVCREALEGLTALSEADADEVEAALPVLVAVLKDRQRRQPGTVLAAVRALLALGTDARSALPVLRAMLRENSPEIAQAIAFGLPEVAPKERELVPALVRALSHPDGSVRRAAAVSLERLGLRARPAVAALVRALADDDVAVRIAAAGALGGLGDATAVTPLTELLKAGDTGAVGAAAEALHRLAPEKDEALPPALIRCLREDPSDEAKALAALRNIDSGAVVLALARALREGDRDTRRTAASILGHSEFFLSEDPRFAGGRREQLAGSWAAVPALRQALHDGDADVRILAASALAGWDRRTKGLASLLCEGLRSPDVLVREQALWGLFSLGPRGQDTLPELIRLLNDPDEADLHLLVLRVLGKMGPEARAAVPALLRCLHDRPAFRVEVLELLNRLADRERAWRPLGEALLLGGDETASTWVWNRFTDDHERAVPALLRALGSNDPDRRRRAAMLLGHTAKPGSTEVVAGLTPLLEDGSPAVRVEAAASLAALDPEGPATAQAVAILTRAARHARDDLRPHAVFLLLLHASTWESLKIAEVSALMRELLHDPDAEVRQHALRFFMREKPKDFPTILIETLRDRELRLRRRAADSIGFCGPEARAAIPTLVEMLGSRDSELRTFAAQALPRVGREDGALAGPLLEACRKTRSKSFRKDLIWALGSLGKGSPAAAVPALVELLQDPDWVTQDWAVRELNAVDPGNPLILPALARVAAQDYPARQLSAKDFNEFGPGLVADLGRLLRREEADQRLGAVLVLGYLRKQAISAAPLLRRALGDEDGRVRLEAARALWEVTEHGEAAVGALRGLVKGKDADLRRRAARLLGEMRAAARDAAPDLIACLKSPDRQLALTAVGSLGHIGKVAPAAVPALLELARGDDPFLRCAAVESLSAFGREARPAVPRLLRLLWEVPTPRDREAAALCLGEIGAAAEAGPALVRVFREEAEDGGETDFLIGLRDPLRKFGPSLREEIDQLLHDRRPGVRAAALSLFHGDFGTGEKDVLPFLPALLEALLDADDTVAVSAFNAVDGRNHLPDVVSVLRRGLKAKETDVRLRSIRFLPLTEREALAAVPDLVALARDDNAAVREAALAALKQIDPEAAAQVRKP